MLGRSWLPARILAAGLTLCLALVVTAQDTELKSKTKDAADPPRTGQYMNQLRALFASWDTNKDDFLDKEELAIAFYGPGAKPYDYKKGKKSDSELKSEDKKDDDKKSDSTKDDDKTPKKKEKTPDYSKRADFVFLSTLDKDRDEKISRDEFMEWARDYATQLRDRADLVKEQQKLQLAQQKLQQQIAKAKPNSKNLKTLQAQQKKQQQQQAKQQQQMNKLIQQMQRYQALQQKLR